MGNASGKEEDELLSPRGTHHMSGETISGGRRYGNTPPDSPAVRSPLVFAPQIPMAPIPRVEEFSLGGAYSVSQSGDASQGGDEGGVPTMIVWSHGGSAISVEGSWDNWTTREPLQPSGKDFTILKVLPAGVYQYKFIVDEQWRYASDLPAVYDEMGNVNNVLEVQEYVPENLENLAGFEPPQSPPSSYDSALPLPEDYAKEPPLVPPHLHLTLLNVPHSGSTLPRPQHVILNHLYVEKGKTSKSVLALGLTHRFRSKYVTVVLYKPLPSTSSPQQ